MRLKSIWLGLCCVLLSSCALSAQPSAVVLASLPATQDSETSPQALPAYSGGCGSAAPQAASSLWLNGVERNMIVRIPETYDANKPHSLIVAFHGRTNSNAKVQRYFGLDKTFSDAIIVYPSGMYGGGAFSWADRGDDPEALRDYALFDAILAHFQAYYCVHPSQVYVVGHSLGAWFANSVACARAGVVRAVASLGGSVTASSCAGQVAAMIIHNPNDQLAPVAKGAQARDLFLASNLLTAYPPQTGYTPIEQDFLCQTYGNGSLDPVVWCPHQKNHYFNRYYPHNWPLDTAELIKTFFSSLP